MQPHGLSSAGHSQSLSHWDWDPVFSQVIITWLVVLYGRSVGWKPQGRFADRILMLGAYLVCYAWWYPWQELLYQIQGYGLWDMRLGHKNTIGNEQCHAIPPRYSLSRSSQDLQQLHGYLAASDPSGGDPRGCHVLHAPPRHHLAPCFKGRRRRIYGPLHAALLGDARGRPAAAGQAAGLQRLKCQEAREKDTELNRFASRLGLRDQVPSVQELSHTIQAEPGD